MNTKPRQGHLYQSGKKGIWQLQYDICGNRTRVSLRTSDEVEAQKRAADIMGRIKFADTREEYLQALVRLGQDASAEIDGLSFQRQSISIESMMQLYIGSRRRPAGATEASMKRYQQYTDELAGWLSRSIRTAEQVTQAITEDYLDFLEDVNSASTINMKLSWFRLLWKTLQCPKNPWEGLSAKKSGPISEWRRFTYEECLMIYRHFLDHPRWMSLFLIGYYSGQRLQDCCKLEWSSVDFKKKVMTIRAGKTGKLAYVPIMPELQDNLSLIRKSEGKVLPVFNAMYEGNDKSAISKQFQRHIANYTVHDELTKTGFHSLRKTFVSMMDESGSPIQVTNSITGHDTGTMHERYSQTDVESARFWMEKSLKSLTE